MNPIEILMIGYYIRKTNQIQIKFEHQNIKTTIIIQNMQYTTFIKHLNYIWRHWPKWLQNYHIFCYGSKKMKCYTTLEQDCYMPVSLQGHLKICWVHHKLWQVLPIIGLGKLLWSELYFTSRNFCEINFEWLFQKLNFMN